MLPFGELEPDHEWLAAHAKKEAAKRERIRREALEVPKAPPALTYTLADKLDEEEPAKPVSEQTRAEALKQIEALRKPAATAKERTYTSEEKRAAVELYRAERDKGAAAFEVAKTIGIPLSTLNYWERLIQSGQPLDRKAGREKGAVDHPQEVREKALALARTGVSHARIGMQLGVSQSTVSRWARAAAAEDGALEPEPPKPAEPSLPPPPPAIEPPPAVQPTAPADDALQQELAALRAENERLRAKVKMLLSMVEGL